MNNIIIGLIIGVFVIVSIYYSFNLIPFLVAMLLTYFTLDSKEKIHASIEKAPSLVYYSMIFTLTLFLSIDEYKNNRPIIMALLANTLVCVGIFFTNSLIVTTLFVFMNFYVVLDIFFFFLMKEFDQTPSQ
jgi:hypothetical protein